MKIVIRKLSTTGVRGNSSTFESTYSVTEKNQEFVIVCKSNQYGRTFSLADREGTLYINREDNRVHWQRVALGGGCGLLIDDEPVEGLSPLAIRGCILAEQMGESVEITVTACPSKQAAHPLSVSVNGKPLHYREYSHIIVEEQRGKDSEQLE